MASLTQIRAGLADRLRTIPSVNVSELAPNVIVAPAMIVTPSQAEIVTMARGTVEYTLTITVLVSMTDITDQNILDGLLETTGPSSVFAAIADDVTLGLEATNAAAMSWTNYGTQTVGDVDYLSVTFPVVVRTSGV